MNWISRLLSTLKNLIEQIGASMKKNDVEDMKVRDQILEIERESRRFSDSIHSKEEEMNRWYEAEKKKLEAEGRNIKSLDDLEGMDD